MPIKSRITTQGFSEYLERLAKAGRDIDVVSDEALAVGGEVLKAGMSTRAPVDQRNEDDIHVRDWVEVDGPHQDGNFHYVEVGLHRQGPFKMSKRMAIYANVLEYSSATQSAQPFIRPTFDGDMAKARAEMKRIFIAAEVGIDG